MVVERGWCHSGLLGLAFPSNMRACLALGTLSEEMAVWPTGKSLLNTDAANYCPKLSTLDWCLRCQPVLWSLASLVN